MGRVWIIAAVNAAGRETTAPPGPVAANPVSKLDLEARVLEAVRMVYDPEIPSDIYELGLIYKVDIEDDRSVKIDMTLTTPNCPSAAELPMMVENAVASVPGVAGAKVSIVWEPPWDQSRMSEEARVARAREIAPAGLFRDLVAPSAKRGRWRYYAAAFAAFAANCNHHIA